MTFIFNKPEFQAAQTAFKTLAKCHTNGAVHAILYNAIRNKDLKRGFTAITNPTKLANGAQAMGSFYQALLSAKWQAKKADTLFGIKLTDEHRAALIAALGA
jgi:tRNA A22 N-methylase